MKILLLAFRGTGGFNNPQYKNEPALIKVGYVGILFEGDNRIFGFHPTSEAAEAAGGQDNLVALLKQRIAQQGRIHEDTTVFERAYALNQQGERTRVIALTYEVSEETFQRVRQTLLEWYNTGKTFQYNFPFRDGSFNEGEYNCATFPKLLGIVIPSEDRLLFNYIAEMERNLGNQTNKRGAF